VVCDTINFFRKQHQKMIKFACEIELNGTLET
jgi:hypothetical protein